MDQIHCVCYLTCAYLSSFRFPFVFNGAPLSSEHDVGAGVERHFVSTLVEQRELVCHWSSLLRCELGQMCVERRQEMTAASVPPTHIFDNQIYRMTQRSVFSVVLSCILSVSFLSLNCCSRYFVSRSDADVYESVFSFWHFYPFHPLSRPTEERIFFLSRSNWHIDISMFKPQNQHHGFSVCVCAMAH